MNKAAILVILGLFLNQGANTVMAGDHDEMTRAAIEVLPTWQHEVLRSQEDLLISRYCGYPDMAAYPEWMPASPAQAEALPWQYVEKGRQYHYGMLESWNRGAHHRQRHEVPIEDNYRFFIRGSEFFFSAIKKALLKNDLIGAAKYAGSFIHANQDPVTRIHCLEDYYGLHWLALESLFYQGNEFDPANSAVQLWIKIPRKKLQAINGYQPQLLGMGPTEAAFHLYRRHIQVLLGSRGQILKMIDLARTNQWEQASELLQTTEQEGAKISADILFTALSMAYERFDATQCQALKTVDLSLMPPLDAPALLSAPYTFSPVARGYALAPDGRKVPLRLKKATSQGDKIQDIACGLATGTHYLGYRLAWLLPVDVYQSFGCQVGLHPDFAIPGSKVSLRIKFRGRTMWHKEFSQADYAAEVSFAVDQGGLLELVLDDALEAGPTAVSPVHIVWGNLQLRK